MLNVPICSQGMQRTWWPEAGTIIVTGPYCKITYHAKCVHLDKDDIGLSTHPGTGVDGASGRDGGGGENSQIPF